MNIKIKNNKLMLIGTKSCNLVELVFTDFFHLINGLLVIRSCLLQYNHYSEIHLLCLRIIFYIFQITVMYFIHNGFHWYYWTSAQIQNVNNNIIEVFISYHTRFSHDSRASVYFIRSYREATSCIVIMNIFDVQ